jgi:imidazolonepropionase-like amidohydrolase
MEMMVASGLTPYEALHTATAAVGKYLGDENHGVIREGANADLVLVAGNPLEDIAALRKPEAVMVRGRLFTPDELDALLKLAEQ